MKAATYHARWFETPVLLPIVVVLAGMLWLGTAELGMPWPLSLLLLSQAVLLFLAFHRPVWALASLLLGQLTTTGYMLQLTSQLQISIHFLWTIMAVLLVMPILAQKGLNLGPTARRVLIPAVLFFIIATVANALNTSLSYTLEYLRETATALVILLLIPALVKTKRDIKLLGLVVLVTALISSVFAIIQYGSYLGVKWLPYYSILATGASEGRMPGLTESPLALSFDISLVILIVLGLLLIKGVSGRAGKILVFLVLVMSLALYFTYTRSAIFGLAGGVLTMALLLKSRLRNEVILVVLIVAVGFFFLSGIASSRYSSVLSDQSAASRPVLWTAGMHIVMDHPIVGIGHERFREVSTAYTSTVSSGLLETQGAGAVLGVYEPHNDFLNVWLSFGTLALIAFVWLWVSIFVNFVRSYRQSSNNFITGLALGCIGALAGLCVNSFLHNIMDSQLFLWILGGLSIAAYNLVLHQKHLREETI